jgi:hypothetical protein
VLKSKDMPKENPKVTIKLNDNIKLGHAYIRQKSENMVMLYVDCYTPHKAYPYATSSSDLYDCVPEVYLEYEENGVDKSFVIELDDYKGWDIFACQGGKTISIALVKGWYDKTEF